MLREGVRPFGKRYRNRKKRLEIEEEGTDIWIVNAAVGKRV